jgi:hypothetical protein
MGQMKQNPDLVQQRRSATNIDVGTVNRFSTLGLPASTQIVSEKR